MLYKAYSFSVKADFVPEIPNWAPFFGDVKIAEDIKVQHIL